MKLPHRAHRSRRWQLFCFFVLSILFIIAGHQSPAAAQKKLAISQITVEEGKTTSETFSTGNDCMQPLHFRAKSSVKYLRIEKPDSVLMAPGATHVFRVLVDATKLKSGIYPGSISVECLDCEKAKCSIKKTVIPVELTVTGAQKLVLETKEQLISYFWKTADDEFKKLEAIVAPDARELLNEMISAGAERMIKNKELDRLEEAEKNLRKLCALAVKYGVKEKGGPPRTGMMFAADPAWPIYVNVASIRKASQNLCPVFPFC